MEHGSKVNVAIAWIKVHFLVPQIIGQANFTDPVYPKSVQKTVDSLWDQMGVVHGESPPKILRQDLVKVVPALFNIVSQVVDFSIIRFLVQVFQKQDCLNAFGILNCLF